MFAPVNRILYFYTFISLSTDTLSVEEPKGCTSSTSGTNRWRRYIHVMPTWGL